MKIMKSKLLAEWKKFNKERASSGYAPESFQMWLVLEYGYSRSKAQDIIDGN